VNPPSKKSRDRLGPLIFLQTRKVLELGDLVIATSADALTAEELAGALLVLAETKDPGRREAWARRGAAFFQGKAR
jgi:hypothetical protein